MDSNQYNTYTTKRLEKDNFFSEIPERISYMYSTLKYNQELIQFADTKANTLLIINSIFIATATTLMQTSQEQTSLGAIFSVLKIAFLIASIASVIYALIVVSPVKENFNFKKKDFIFYMDILSNKNPDNFYYEFSKTKTTILLEDLAKRCYIMASIASSKYLRYNRAQTVTFVSCILWLASIFLYYFL